MHLIHVARQFHTIVLLALLAGCQTGGGGGGQIPGNENGSAPANETERNAYKAAILKCYKTGGTRIVKIDGNLRCFN